MIFHLQTIYQIFKTPDFKAYLSRLTNKEIPRVV